MSATIWYGMPALVLESELLRVVVVPQLGAKLVSLFDRRNRYEWLIAPARPLRPVAYGAPFVEQDMSGWDEMFPTIDACAFPSTDGRRGPWLPDHGEVWALAWAVGAATACSLHTAVDGVAVPYRLGRTATITPDGVLELTYELTNTGQAPLPYLWAAHPQLTAVAGTEVVLPAEVDEVWNALADDAAWGAPLAPHSWPAAVDRLGQWRRLDQVGPNTRRDCRKFYLPPGRPAAWAGLANRATGHWLRLSWRGDGLDYLGVWVDEGAYSTEATVALEPATGFYDSLAVARAGGRVSVASPGETRRWALRVAVGRGEGRP